MDRDAMRYYELREVALASYQNELKYREEQGVKQGTRKEKLEIARKCKVRGDSFEAIGEVTGLSLDEIAQL
jgi:predicted transposase/invertase (TIGR01784 family)